MEFTSGFSLIKLSLTKFFDTYFDIFAFYGKNYNFKKFKKFYDI